VSTDPFSREASSGDGDTPPLNDRQAHIVERVEHDGFVTIEQLARDFSVSAQTVRREIIRLDELGVLKRFHGGAGRLGSGLRLSYEAKLAIDTEQKSRIAGAAALMIGKGQTIFLDVGTTAEALAAALTNHPGLRVITPSGASARRLAQNPSAEVIVTGGKIVGSDLSMAGPIALRTVASYRFDLAFIGCSGVAPDGSVLDFDADKIALKQQAIRGAARKILIADGSKLGRGALMVVAQLDAFDGVITDAPWTGALRVKSPPVTIA
jgi:DeoR family transcriptional regulator, glycerol-3-phosphate regulon repressor